MARLLRSNPNSPGIRRQRRGKGFGYRHDNGQSVDGEDRSRIAALVIPPAWENVWISPSPLGHIQAVGTDAAGRRQYLYHEQWRSQRDTAKHQRVLDFGRRLPQARERMSADLATRGLGRRRVLGAAGRLLDLGFFRVGCERYAEENGSCGLATIRREHVSLRRGGTVVFDYPAKSGLQRIQAVADPDVVEVIRALCRRRGGGDELLAFWEARHWHDLRSSDINDYLREVVGLDATAKDFRTWHATTLAAVALAVPIPGQLSENQRKRMVSHAMREVSSYLGNTPAVCRRSYVDPRVIDLFEQGVTIRSVLDRLGADADRGQLATLGAVERAVLRMLQDA